MKNLKYLILIVLIITLLTYIMLNSKKEKSTIIVPKITDIYEDLNQNKSSEEIQIESLLEDYNNKKILVLTFDDGPGKYTEYLVEQLKKRNIPATFFILGENIIGNEEILRKTAIDNEIALHSYSHKLFTKLSNKEILDDISKLKEKIESVTGKVPNIIRVPYGSLNSRVSTLLLENNLISVTWDIDSKDWSFRNVDKTYNYTMKYMKGNSIILMHDIYKPSVDCALKLVDTLKDEYTFVTISTYLKLVNYSKEKNNLS